MQEDERSALGASVESQVEEPVESGGHPKLGTARMVKDLFPPISGPPWWGPYPESLVEFRGRLFFAANFEDGRGELWRSDGSRAGTVPVRSFRPPPGTTFSSPLGELTPLGSRLFFVASDPAHGRELWVSDGSAGGTQLVKDIVTGVGDSSPYNLQAVGNFLIFFRYIGETPTSPARTELWRSDGTASGTVRVQALGSDTYLSYVQTVVGDTLFFVLTDPDHGTELWKTDGTPSGTMLVKDIAPGPDSSYPFGLQALGRYVYFTATEATSGRELWRSDGTPEGTTLVADMRPGEDSYFIQVLETADDRLYFTMADPLDGSTLLYRLRNGSEGPRIRFVATLPNPSDVLDSSTFVTTSVGADGRLFLALAVHGSGPAPLDVQLWVTDGTNSGTRMLHHPLSLSDEFGSTLFALDDRILFSGGSATTGLELWVSNGRRRGTRLLRDLAPGGASSYPQRFTRVGSSVFFVANDGVHGNELWVLPLRP
ncbi:ELWxxDGT repeat protein [Hyalangium gracile]|uniref:ELWxxDGT repeat protein n=1 Tax=Hyalangium gracile TaxID=394092 RepID=UPI001CCBF69D|nr:ELWxxDGT repeat protein [Hyalangium gracile]